MFLSLYESLFRPFLRYMCLRGLMDKASDSGSGDCGFDSHRGYDCFAPGMVWVFFVVVPNTIFSSFIFVVFLAFLDVLDSWW